MRLSHRPAAGRSRPPIPARPPARPGPAAAASGRPHRRPPAPASTTDGGAAPPPDPAAAAAPPPSPPPLPPPEDEDEAAAAARFATYPAWRLRAELRWRQADDGGDVGQLAGRLAALLAGGGGGGGGFGAVGPSRPADGVLNAMTAVEMRGVLRAWGVPAPKTKAATLARLRSVLDGGWRPTGGPAAASAAAAAAAAAAGTAPPDAVVGDAGPPPAPRPASTRALNAANAGEDAYADMRAPDLRSLVRSRGLVATSSEAAALKKAALVALLVADDAARAGGGGGDGDGVPPPPPPAPAQQAPQQVTDIAAWTTPELAAALRARGVRPTGKKAELVARLRATLAEEASRGGGGPPLLLPPSVPAGGLAAGGGGPAAGARAPPPPPSSSSAALTAAGFADAGAAPPSASSSGEDGDAAAVEASALTPVALAIELVARGLADAPPGGDPPTSGGATAAARSALAAALRAEHETGRTTRRDIFPDDDPADVADAADPELVSALADLAGGLGGAWWEWEAGGPAAPAPPRARLAVLTHWPSDPDGAVEPLAGAATLLELGPRGAGRDAFGGAAPPERAGAGGADADGRAADAAPPAGLWVDAWLVDAGTPGGAGVPVTRAPPAALLCSADPADVSAALALGSGGGGEAEGGPPAPPTLAALAASLAEAAAPSTASPSALPTVAFPMLQGAPEGGAPLLAALAEAGVPFIGPTPEGAALCADRVAAGAALAAAGLATVPRAELTAADFGGDGGLAQAVAGGDGDGGRPPPPPASAAGKVEALLRSLTDPSTPPPPDGAGLPLVVKLSRGRGGSTARLVTGVAAACAAAADLLSSAASGGGRAAVRAPAAAAAPAPTALVEPFLSGAVPWRVLVIGTEAGPLALTPAEVDLSSPEFDVADAAAAEDAAAAAAAGWALPDAAAVGARARAAARAGAGAGAALYSPARRSPVPGAGDARPPRLVFPPRLPVETVRAIRSAAAAAAGALGARDLAVVDGWAARTDPLPPPPSPPPLDIDLTSDEYVARYPDRPDEAVPHPHVEGPGAEVALREAAAAQRAAALAAAAPAPPQPLTSGGGHAIMVAGVDAAPPLGEADFAFACAADAGITHGGLLSHLVSRARARFAAEDAARLDAAAVSSLKTPLPTDRAHPALWSLTALARDAGVDDVPLGEEVGSEADLRAEVRAADRVADAWREYLETDGVPPPEPDASDPAAAEWAAEKAAWAARLGGEEGGGGEEDGAGFVSELEALAEEGNAAFAADAAALADLASTGVWGGPALDDAGVPAPPLSPATSAAVAEGALKVEADHGRAFNSALGRYGAASPAAAAEPGGWPPPFDLVPGGSHARPPPPAPGRVVKQEVLARAGAPPPRWAPGEGAGGGGSGGWPAPAAWTRAGAADGPPLPLHPPPPPSPPLRVWVLFGGDGPDRHASHAAGVHAWLALAAAGGGDVLAEPFLLAPAACSGGAREPERRAALMARRATLLRAGIPEASLPPGLSIDAALHPAPLDTPPACREVYALTPSAALRAWADDAHIAAETDARAASVAPAAVTETVRAAGYCRASTLAQLDAAGVAGAGGAWGESAADRVRAAGWAASTPGAPLPASTAAQPTCRCMAVHELGEEAAAAGAVILLALGAGAGSGGEAGEVAAVLRAAGAVVSGPDAAAAARAGDASAVGAALADLEVHSVSAPPRAAASAADLSAAAESDAGAEALLARLRAGVGGSPGPLRARPGAGGTACGAGADVVIEDAAGLRAFAAAASTRGRTLPDGRGGLLEAPPSGLDGALFEPGVPPDGAALTDAGTAEWTSPRNRWLRAAVALVGERGAMRALTPTVALADGRPGADGRVVRVTPPPHSLARPDAMDGARARCELVADRLGLAGGAVLGCYIHADSADVIVSDVAGGGLGAGVGGPGAGRGGGAAGLVARGGPLLRQALAEEPPVHAPEVLRELVRLAADDAEAASAAAAAEAAAAAAAAAGEDGAAAFGGGGDGEGPGGAPGGGGGPTSSTDDLSASALSSGLSAAAAGMMMTLSGTGGVGRPSGALAERGGGGGAGGDTSRFVENQLDWDE